MKQKIPNDVAAKGPPYLSVIEDAAGDPHLVLTVAADAINVCDQCPHIHVRMFDRSATPDALRRFSTSLRQWADDLEEQG